MIYYIREKGCPRRNGGGTKQNMKCTVIGVAGGTGSGKSTFTNRIKREFGNDVTVIYFDNYYRRRDDMSLEERKLVNYDHPDALETDLLIENVTKLINGIAVDEPVYDFTVHNRSDKIRHVEPSRILIIEGILALHDQRLRNLMDIKVYVEADADERILRRVIRDVRDRGRDLEGIARQYLTTVKPMHYAYVEPTRYLADLVINSGMNQVAFDLVKTKIEKILQEK